MVTRFATSRKDSVLESGVSFKPIEKVAPGTEPPLVFSVYKNIADMNLKACQYVFKTVTTCFHFNYGIKLTRYT